MSYEYHLVGLFPFEHPEAEALDLVASVLGAAVTIQPNLSPRVHVHGLLVVAVESDDDESPDEGDLTVGFASNLSLIFADGSAGDGDLLIRVMQDITRVAVRFAQVPGLKGLLLSDFSDDSIVLRIDEAGVTLNRAWDGWDLWPEVLSLVPEPRRFDHLHLSR